MTKKSDLQQELLKEVTPGIKPSDLKRKLKRSKSADDIVNIPTPPPPPDHLLSDQLKEKQTELENLRKALETANQALTETKQQLDDSLAARTNSLSDWTKQREIIKTLNKELDDTVEQASSEINQGDTEISQLRTKIWTLKSAKESLERELKLARINRSTLPLTSNDYETKLDYFQYGLYALLAVWFILVLNHSWKTNQNHA